MTNTPLDDFNADGYRAVVDSLVSSLEGDDDIMTARGMRRDIIMSRKLEKRRFLNAQKIAALEGLVPELPPPDTDLFIITTGLGAEVGTHAISKSPDLGTFIPYIVEKLGNVDCIAHISTWTCNHFHSLSMLELLDTGKVKRLIYFSDPYFMQRSPAIATPLVEGLRSRGQIVKLWKNHTKIIAIANADETRSCVVMSSANLSSQPRAEQLHITTSQDVYQWVKTEFFEALLRQPDYEATSNRPRKPKK